MVSKKSKNKSQKTISAKEVIDKTYEDQVNNLLNISTTRKETKKLASNNISREMLFATLKEIVQAWNGCDATVSIAPDVGVSRLFKAIGIASKIIESES